MSDQSRNRRAHTRYTYGRAARAYAEGGEIQGTVQDISRGGASLLLNSPLANDAFIQLHVEGVGQVPSKVVRQFEQGVGVQFDFHDTGVASRAPQKPGSAKAAAAGDNTSNKKEDPLADTVGKLLDFIDSLKPE